MFGLPYSVPYAGPEEFLASVSGGNVGDGVRVRAIPYEHCGQYYRLYVDGQPCGAPRWIDSGDTGELIGPYWYTGTAHFFTLAPQGFWDADLDLSCVPFAWLSGRARRIWVEATGVPAFVVLGATAQLSGWDLSGLNRFTNCRPVPWRPTWGSLHFAVWNSGASYVTRLSLDGLTLCSGTGTGAVTFIHNTGNVSGGVTLEYTGDASGTLFVCWPAEVRIHWKTGSGWTGADFPRAADLTGWDVGAGVNFKLASPTLSGSVYYVLAHQVDEDGNESTGLAAGGTAVTTYSPPSPPSGLVYVTGTGGNTQIGWNTGGSATGFRVYDSLSGTGVSFDAANIETGATGVTLSGLVAGWSGTRYVVVRALLAGVEEGNTDVLVIEYSGAARVDIAPPVPGVARNVHTTGLTVSLTVTLNLAEELGTPATWELFLIPAANTTTGYANPDATGSWTGTGWTLTNEITGTAAASGEYYYAVRAKTAGGVPSQVSPSLFGPVRLTTTQPAMPSFTARAGL